MRRTTWLSKASVPKPQSLMASDVGGAEGHDGWVRAGFETKGVLMPVAADPSFGSLEAAVAFGVILLVAFLVTWVVTDLLRVPRAPYVATLTVVTLALAAGYLSWSETSFVDLATTDWVWAIAAGLVAGLVVAPGVRRLQPHERRHGSALAMQLAWEGVIYGIAEALLLATLPVLAVWHAAEDLGWTDSLWPKIGAGAFTVVGALVVIVVHHLGYRGFRGAAARPRLMGALLGCGLQALAFLLTGNVLAPIVAHIVLHWQMAFRGVELPPEAGSRATPGVEPQTASWMPEALAPAR